MTAAERNTKVRDGSEFQFDKTYYVYSETDEQIGEVIFPRESSFIENAAAIRRYGYSYYLRSLHSTKEEAMREMISDLYESAEVLRSKAKQMEQELWGE